ncbi:hypothetical protein KAI87_01720 [Myxococcota bacterium]|nr:hypothetical protein [Myxococcota bacterium]
MGVPNHELQSHLSYFASRLALGWVHGYHLRTEAGFTGMIVGERQMLGGFLAVRSDL